MSQGKKKSNKITIYLIKENVKYEDILKKDISTKIMCEGKNSVTYYVPTTSNKPDWLISYFNEKGIDGISNSHAKVISLHKLTIDNCERVFAIPFGLGKVLLNDDVIEEQFGIKVLLNSVTGNSFRQISSSNYGGNHNTRNELIPKKTSISEFGFDIHNDFLRKATAKSDDELFNNNTIVGADLLGVSVPVNIDNVDDFLISCYERYKCEKYKENFEWIDNIKEVKEKTLRQSLNDELLKHINNGDTDVVYAAIPEIVEWEKILDFRLKKTLPGYDDVEISDIMNLFENGVIPNIEILKSKKIYAMSNESDEPLYEWSIYNCLIAEIEYKEKAYCLNFGKWYVLNTDFVDKTNNYYNEIPLSDIDFPNCFSSREDQYNENLCKHLNDSILMDKKTVRVFEIGRSSIELCDVLTCDNCLIHVKKNRGSSALSHLFNQAAVSGDMLLDERFREEANKQIGRAYFDGPFSPNSYNIILAIITKKNKERPDIPFFSKAAIQYTVSGLRRKGYKVTLKNIYNEAR